MQAYIDSLCVIALAFGEPAADEVAARLQMYARIASSNLLEAELSSVFRRENKPYDRSPLAQIRWVMPERRLTSELERVFAAGYLRGADAWHVACALYMTDSPIEVDFLTLDKRQRDVAAQLGFPTP